MHRIRYNSLALAVIAICTVFAMGAGVAHATPLINAAKDSVRVFNDCPVTNLNAPPPAYPANIHFDESNLICGGGQNLHVWNLSDDGGASSALFNNKDAFSIAATVTINKGSIVQTEGGLRICPWWDPVANGFFNMRLPDGEIACFGGVLPFFSFTAAYGVRYTGGPARQMIIYIPNCNTKDNPGTIEYILDYNGAHYDSGPLQFGNCTAGEEAHGCYGIMDNARVGGRVANEMYAFGGDPNPAADNAIDFNDIIYQIIPFQPDCPVSTQNTTWGKLKASYH